jgi:hypothetical protein
MESPIKAFETLEKDTGVRFTRQTRLRFWIVIPLSSLFLMFLLAAAACKFYYASALFFVFILITWIYMLVYLIKYEIYPRTQKGRTDMKIPFQEYSRIENERDNIKRQFPKEI